MTRPLFSVCTVLGLAGCSSPSANPAAVIDGGTHVEVDGAAERDSGGADGAPVDANIDGAIDAGVDAAAVEPADAGPHTIRCGPGLACDGLAFCGYSDGHDSAACVCDTTDHFVCGGLATAPPCRVGEPPAPCDRPFYVTPVVICASLAGTGCTMEACHSTPSGGNLGWGGPCERLPAECPPAGSEWCGDSCVPVATGCTCQRSALDPTLTPCTCLEVPVEVEPSGGRLFCTR